MTIDMKPLAGSAGSETYRGYPALEQVAMDRKDPRLKPAALLRFWYLLQDQEPEIDRETAFDLWRPLGLSRTNMRAYLGQGDGVWWERQGETHVRVRTADDLLSAHDLEARVRVRPSSGLYLTTKDWHRTLVEDAAEDLGSSAERVTQAQIAARVGFTRSTVKRLGRLNRLHG